MTIQPRNFSLAALGLTLLMLGFLLGQALPPVIRDRGRVAQMSDSEHQTMTDGMYRIYSRTKMFDSVNGAPVYWVVAGKMQPGTTAGTSLDIEPSVSEIRLYIIPRTVIQNLPDDGRPESDLRTQTLVIKGGVGHLKG